MSVSDIKKISINNKLFKLKKNKNKTLKKNIKTVRNLEPNKLKSDLLNKIKNYKEDKKQELLKLSYNQYNESVNKIAEDENELKEKPKIHMETDLESNVENNDEFMESINFLKTLTNPKKKKKIRKKLIIYQYL